MKRSMLYREVVVFLFLTALLIPACRDDSYLEIEKEQVKYKERMENITDKIDRKLAMLKTEVAEADEERQKDIRLRIVQLETLEERLNHKLGEIETVPDNEWPTLKSEIDELIGDYEQIIKQIDA